VSLTVPPGVAVGTYPVTVTVSAPGVDSVALTASVEVRPVGSCALNADGQCAFDLGEEYNVDGVATVAASTQGNFDGAGWAYDAALMPAPGTVTWDGIPYTTPDTGGTTPNFVATNGQTLLVPPDRYGAVHIIAASHHGPVSGGVMVNYTDGTSASTSVDVGDWCGDPRAGTTVALSMDHRIRNGGGEDGPAVKLFSIPIPLDRTKSIRSITLPEDDRILIYALTLA
jgi:hypothetical protein